MIALLSLNIVGSRRVCSSKLSVCREIARAVSLLLFMRNVLIPLLTKVSHICPENQKFDQTVLVTCYLSKTDGILSNLFLWNGTASPDAGQMETVIRRRSDFVPTW